MQTTDDNLLHDSPTHISIFLLFSLERQIPEYCTLTQKLPLLGWVPETCLFFLV
jgi:hypothetical protein